jgi:hypothetical protein
MGSKMSPGLYYLQYKYCSFRCAFSRDFAWFCLFFSADVQAFLRSSCLHVQTLLTDTLIERKNCIRSRETAIRCRELPIEDILCCRTILTTLLLHHACNSISKSSKCYSQERDSFSFFCSRNPCRKRVSLLIYLSRFEG